MAKANRINFHITVAKIDGLKKSGVSQRFVAYCAAFIGRDFDRAIQSDFQIILLISDWRIVISCRAFQYCGR